MSVQNITGLIRWCRHHFIGLILVGILHIEIWYHRQGQYHIYWCLHCEPNRASTGIILTYYLGKQYRYEVWQNSTIASAGIIYGYIVGKVNVITADALLM